jgi:hypothetical protein
MDGHSAMTLDEPVWHTVKRDLLQVGSKLQVVLLPRENQDGVLKKLKDCECAWNLVGGGGQSGSNRSCLLWKRSERGGGGLLVVQ